MRNELIIFYEAKIHGTEDDELTVSQSQGRPKLFLK